MASITRQTSVSDAIVEAVRAFFDTDKNRDLSQIDTAKEAERIASIRVKAEFYGDGYTTRYMNYRNRVMLNLGRKNAEIVRDIVSGVTREVEETQNENLGVKQQFEEFINANQNK